MSVLVIVDVTVNDPQRYRAYVAGVPALIARHEGRYLVRGGDVVVREGSWQPGRLVVLEFPSAGHADAFLNDPDYRPLAAIRHQAADTNMVMVHTLDDASARPP